MIGATVDHGRHKLNRKFKAKELNVERRWAVRIYINVRLIKPEGFIIRCSGLIIENKDILKKDMLDTEECTQFSTFQPQHR